MLKRLIFIPFLVLVIGALWLVATNKPPEKMGGATASDLEQKYNSSPEIKATYALDSASLVNRKVLNPNLDKYKNEPKDEIEVRVGNKPTGQFGADETFEPTLEIRRWNEVGFKISPNLSAVALKDRTLMFEKEKIKYDTPKISFELYPYTEGEGGMKMVWYLNKKPASNIVSFKIETSGLDFFLQPPLTEEYQNGYSEEFQREIVVTETQVKDLEGNILVERPENIVGSYAVYHSTKGGLNDINGKDYKVGKFGHIFRPRLCDSNNWCVWGNLNIDAVNGIYLVEIPQDFLNKAVYPIKSNDTIGYNDTAGTVSNLAGDTIRVSSTWAGANGTVTKITALCDDAGSGSAHNARGVIYKNSDDSRVTFGAATQIPHVVDPTVQDFDVTDIAIAAGTNYDIGVWLQTGNADNFYYDTGTHSLRRDSTAYHATNDPPATFTQASVITSRDYIIYAPYTPSEEAPKKSTPPAILWFE